MNTECQEISEQMILQTICGESFSVYNKVFLSIQIEGINQRTIQKLVSTSWISDFWRVLRNPALLILAKSWEKSFIEYCRSRRTLQRTFSLIFNISQSKNSNLWWCRCDLSLIRSCFLVISLVFSANNVPDIPADVTGQPRPEYKVRPGPILLTPRVETSKECHIQSGNKHYLKLKYAKKSLFLNVFR